MAVGIRFRQQNQIKVIDDRYSNLALVAKGTYTTNNLDTDVWVSPTVNPNRRYVRVTGRTNPVMAIRATNSQNYGGGGRCRRVDRGGGVFDFYFSMPQGELPPYAPATAIPYFIFDVNPDAKTGIGFVIRNKTTGQIVFDSRHRYMKVVGFIQRTATFTYNVTRRWDYGYASSNLAAIQSQLPIKFFDFGSGQGGSEAYTMRTAVYGNVVTVIEGKEWDIFGNLVTPWVPTSGFAAIVIDTTGL